MRCTIPEIAWHNRDPVYSVDVQPKPIKCGVDETVYRLASGGTDSHVLIWHITVPTKDADPTIAFASDLNRHQRAVNVVRFSPSGEILASGDDESVVMLWKLKTEGGASGELWQDETSQGTEQWVMTKILRGHHEDVYDLSWSPDSQYLISGSVDNTAIIWDIAKGKNEGILSDHKGFVQGVAWDPLNKYLATLSSDRICRIFSVNSKRVVKRISKSSFGKPEIGPDGKEKMYHLFHDDTFKSFFRRLTFSPDGELLIAPSGVMDVVKSSHGEEDEDEDDTVNEEEEVKPKIEAKAEAEEETKAGVKAETKAGVKAETKAEAKAETKAGVKVEAKAESKAGVKAETKAEAKAETKAGVKAETKAEAKTEDKAGVKAETKAEVKAEAKAETKAGVKAETKAEAKAESKAGVKAEAKAESKAGLKAETKAEAKTEDKAGVKAEAKTEDKAGVKAEAKTEDKAGTSSFLEKEEGNKNGQEEEVEEDDKLDTSRTPSSSELEESFTEDKDTIVMLALANSRKFRKPRPRHRRKKTRENNHNTIQIFTRHEFNSPAVYLPTGTRYTIAVRCCPILFELRFCCKLDDSMEDNKKEQEHECENKQEGEDRNMDDETERPIWEQRNSLIPLPYRVVFAVATHDSVMLYDTQQSIPIGSVANNHYTRLSDLSWSSDGLVLIASSTDGYCSIITFQPGELGDPYQPPLESSEDTVAPSSDIGDINKSLITSMEDDEDEEIRLVLEDTLTGTDQKMDIPDPSNSDKLADHSPADQAVTSAEAKPHTPSDTGKTADIDATQKLDLPVMSSVNDNVKNKELMMEASSSEFEKGNLLNIENAPSTTSAEKNEGVEETKNYEDKNQILNSLVMIRNVNDNQDKFTNSNNDSNVKNVSANNAVGNNNEKQNNEIKLVTTNIDNKMEVVSPKKEEKIMSNGNQEGKIKLAESKYDGKMDEVSPKKGDERKNVTPVKCTPDKQNIMSPHTGSSSELTPSKRTPRRVPFVTLSSPKSKRELT